MFGISASAASWEAGEIATTLTPSAKTPAFSPPKFTIAGCTCHPASTSYELTLPAGPPAGPQIEAQVSVPKTAPAGETVEFSATVSVASGSGSTLTATASAPAVTVAMTAASASPTSSPKAAAGSTSGRSTSSGSVSSGPGAALPSGVGVALPSGAGSAGIPIGALPAIGSGPSGRTINVPAGSAANLFPQITPSAAPSHAPKTGRGANPDQGAVDAAAANPISLNSAQFGSQLIGLIVLLLGVAVVATGISVRKVRGPGKPGPSVQ